MQRLLTAFLLAMLACAALAQEPQPLDKESRGKYMAAVREAKHEFLARELDLTEEQQSSFFPVYDQMDEEIARVNVETRDLEKKVSADLSATNTELESAARTMFEQKGREGQIELVYFEKFKKILTPQQLLRLKNAERKFTQQLVRRRGDRVKTDNKR